ncbi:MAG TPA: aspartate/glutamate racemase family protein [Solirubrobacteraceae bacterium]|jgi:maleate isomerase
MGAAPDTEAVGAEREFGDPGVRHRIGLIELATGETAERDFHAMMPDGGMFHTSRVLNENPVTLENLSAHRSRLGLAAEQLLPGVDLDVICYDCTSGTVASGYEAIAAEIQRVRPGVPVVTPVTAAISAFEKLGVKRISVLTPYTADVNAAMAEYLEARGVEILNLASFELESDIDMARLTPASIRLAAIETCAPDAEALFISCTALRAAEVVDEIEAALGKPVISSIQAEFWQCIRLAGYGAPIHGFGRLLREH